MDIKRQKIDCLRFIMCPLLAPGFQGFFSFFFMWPLTVLMKQTRQVVFTIKQSILLRCLWSYWILVSSFMTSCDSVVGIRVSWDSVIRDWVTLSYWPSLNGEMCFGHFKHCVINAAFLCFETSKLWVLICIFVDRWKAEGLR